MRDPASRRPEPAFIRLLSLAGVLAIGVALGAILTSQHSSGWLVGLVVSLVTLGLGAAVRAMTGENPLR
ncbi:MAG: hypothetical protein ACR2ND_12065 [Solirubrobacteraceae bacterium]